MLGLNIRIDHFHAVAGAINMRRLKYPATSDEISRWQHSRPTVRGTRHPFVSVSLQDKYRVPATKTFAESGMYHQGVNGGPCEKLGAGVNA
jgi:hypothetical protein